MKVLLIPDDDEDFQALMDSRKQVGVALATFGYTVSGVGVLEDDPDTLYTVQEESPLNRNLAYRPAN